jgi:hypothetical protein
MAPCARGGALRALALACACVAASAQLSARDARVEACADADAEATTCASAQRHARCAPALRARQCAKALTRTCAGNALARRPAACSQLRAGAASLLQRQLAGAHMDGAGGAATRHGRRCGERAPSSSRARRCGSGALHHFVPTSTAARICSTLRAADARRARAGVGVPDQLGGLWAPPVDIALTVSAAHPGRTGAARPRARVGLQAAPPDGRCCCVSTRDLTRAPPLPPRFFSCRVCAEL